jgi:hypothetical protein
MSMEGKETQIKSILQAVPTFPMGCFQLSKKMCGSLGSIASRFWWGGGGQTKNTLDQLE